MILQHLILTIFYDFFFNFCLRKTWIFAFLANLSFDFSEIQQGPSEFFRLESDKKISCWVLKFERKFSFFPLIKVGYCQRNKICSFFFSVWKSSLPCFLRHFETFIWKDQRTINYSYVVILCILIKEKQFFN